MTTPKATTPEPAVTAPTPTAWFELRGDPAGQEAWRAMLETLCAWPRPGTIAIERCLLRPARGRPRELLAVTSDAVGVLEGAAGDLESLVRPLQAAMPMQSLAPATTANARPAARLAGLGSAPLPAPDVRRRLFEAAVDDLLSLPGPAGLGLRVFRQVAPDQEEARVLRAMRVGPEVELQVVGVSAPPLAAALTVFASGHVPAPALARLAAACGLDGQAWRQPTGVERGYGDGSEGEHVVATERVAYLLSEPWTGTRVPAGRCIGAPWQGGLPKQGAALGRVFTSSGRWRGLKLPWEQRRLHTFVCGRTGSGKSELLARLAADDLAEGRGLVLIDPHGDLADRVLGLVPDGRRDEVVLIEPADPRSAAIDVLDPRATVQERAASLNDVLSEMNDVPGNYYTKWRRRATLALSVLDATEGVDATVVGVDRFLCNEDVRLGIQLALGEDPLAYSLSRWSRYDWDGPVRTGGLSESPGRFAFDHQPRYRLQEHIAGGGIVIARLGIGSLGVGDASSIGRALLAHLLAAVTTLGDLPPEQRPPLSIVVDEAHLFAGGRALGAMLAQVRKFGAVLSLGTQTPSRLGALLPEVLTNCATVFAMRLPEREANALADRGGPAAIRQIVSLPRYHAVAFLEDTEADAEPRVVHPIRTLPERPDPASEAADTARRRFGRRAADATRGDVERWAVLAEGLEEHVQGLAGRMTARELWRRRAELTPPGGVPDHAA